MLIFIAVVVWYIKNANTSHRAFEITYVNNDKEVKVNSEEIIYNDLKNSNNSTSEEKKLENTSVHLSLINRSGVPGIGAEIKLKLENKGYEVSELEADFSSIQKKTVIIYSEGHSEEALKISAELNNSLVSLSGDEDKNKEPIVVYLGSDLAE